MILLFSGVCLSFPFVSGIKSGKNLASRRAWLLFMTVVAFFSNGTKNRGNTMGKPVMAFLIRSHSTRRVGLNSASQRAFFTRTIVPPLSLSGLTRRQLLETSSLAICSGQLRQLAIMSSKGDNNNSVGGKKDDDKIVVPETVKNVPLGNLWSPEEYSIPSSFPDIKSDLPVGQRIVSFGDIHGDIRALKQFLVTARVMDDATSKWIGNNTICVQCGDILDRGDEELECLRLMASLARQAEEEGGALVMLHGNHEAMNAEGHFQYANPGGNFEFDHFIGKKLDQQLNTPLWRLQYADNQPARWAACEPGGVLAQQLLSNMKVVVVVGRTCFVHAGLTAGHIKNYGGIEGMNRATRDWFLNGAYGEFNNTGQYETLDQIIRAAQNRAEAGTTSIPDCLSGGIGDSSPIWMRSYSQPANRAPTAPNAQGLIDDALNAIGHDVQRMVMGHTPQRHINAALKGKAWRVDVGASKGVMSGSPEVLEIIHKGAKNGDDIVNVLTMYEGVVPSKERQIVEF
mmetsp:Transcript_16624/g.25431  ORF Transcript_16624/g.25431 Transcript_16624/m.25431 type:complete len:513 (+) Transcript_16624:104-1642(+)